MSSCGGNDPSVWNGPGTTVDPNQIIGGLSLPDFVLQATGSDTSSIVNLTNPQGWDQVTAGSVVQLEIDIKFNGYFAANPIGHVAIILRNDAVQLPQGAGIVMGNLSGATPYGSTIVPTTQIESFAAGIFPPGMRHLWAGEAQGYQNKLQDGVQYKFVIASALDLSGRKFTRFRQYHQDTVGQSWELDTDSGFVQIDFSNLIPYQRQGILFAQVFSSNISPSNIFFSNAKVTWGAFQWADMDATKKLSTLGGWLDGDLIFRQPGRRIFTYMAGLTFNDWTRFAPSTGDTNGQVVVAPAGTATAAGFVAANREDLSQPWTLARWGINNQVAQLETYSVNGAPSVPINFLVQGQVAMTVTTDAKVQMPGAPLKINTASTRSTEATNWGGPNARALTGPGSTPWNFDSLCVPGAWTQPSSGSIPQNIANVFAVIFSYVSSLYADVRDRGIVNYNQ